MASPSKETSPANSTPPANPAAPSFYQTFYADLQNDGKSVLNQAVWNMALLYPFYHFDVDQMIFSRNDSDLIASGKLAGVVAGITEGQKLVRRTLLQAGVSKSITHPFGQV